MKLRNKNKKIQFILFFLMIGFVSGIAISMRMDLLPGSNAEDKPKVLTEIGKSGEKYTSLYDLEKSLMRVAEEVGQAVVSISTVRTEKVGYPFGFFGEDDVFKKFFRDFFGDIPEREFKQQGLGSGVIIDGEGYILTNEHVISGAEKITVKLSDGREFKAKVKGTDPMSDLAILKIDAKNLPVAELGNSDDIKTGQVVVAIGNPFGFYLQSSEPTVTMGVISALHRRLPQARFRQRFYGDLIQTDAAINPGNSGGPLVDLNGKVIGINVAIFSSTGGYQGVGFAIPINTAKAILGRLVEGKKILYGWLGISIQDITDDLKEYFGLKDKKGVLVAKVLPDSPAEKAGFKEGDVIKVFDGKQIEDVRELLVIVGRTEVGKKVKAEIIRNGKFLTLTVEVGERPQELENISKEENIARWRGIEVRNITDEMANRYNIPKDKGVIVSQVEPSSYAAQIGIRSGDIIYEINRKPISSVEDFKEVTGEIKGKALIRTQKGYLILKEK
jgi:serine protease Do